MSVRRDGLLLLAAALLVAAPLVLKLPGDYGGSDDKARDAVAQIAPGYQPWFAPLWQPPSSEVASLLFALQAAAGAGLLGYVLGRYHRRRNGRE